MRQLGMVLLVTVLHLSMAACGLDGVTGQLVRLDGSHYTIVTPGGRELVLHVDHTTRADRVTEGDHVHAYITKTGHAEFLQRLE
jgi:hypothetical protein